jgi:DNA-directed RNA polymerase specialized sigma24 family protein
VITEPEGQSLAQRWPDIADSLRRYLASRGVSSHDNDDLVQQVAMTALTTPHLDQIENLEATRGDAAGPC